MAVLVPLAALLLTASIIVIVCSICLLATDFDSRVGSCCVPPHCDGTYATAPMVSGHSNLCVMTEAVFTRMKCQGTANDLSLCALDLPELCFEAPLGEGTLKGGALVSLVDAVVFAVIALGLIFEARTFQLFCTTNSRTMKIIAMVFHFFVCLVVIAATLPTVAFLYRRPYVTTNATTCVNMEFGNYCELDDPTFTNISGSVRCPYVGLHPLRFQWMRDTDRLRLPAIALAIVALGAMFGGGIFAMHQWGGFFAAATSVDREADTKIEKSSLAKPLAPQQPRFYGTLDDNTNNTVP